MSQTAKDIACEKGKGLTGAQCIQTTNAGRKEGAEQHEVRTQDFHSAAGFCPSYPSVYTPAPRSRSKLNDRDVSGEAEKGSSMTSDSQSHRPSLNPGSDLLGLKRRSGKVDHCKAAIPCRINRQRRVEMIGPGVVVRFGKGQRVGEVGYQVGAWVRIANGANKWEESLIRANKCEDRIVCGKDGTWSAGRKVGGQHGNESKTGLYALSKAGSAAVSYPLIAVHHLLVHQHYAYHQTRW